MSMVNSILSLAAKEWQFNDSGTNYRTTQPTKQQLLQLVAVLSCLWQCCIFLRIRLTSFNINRFLCYGFVLTESCCLLDFLCANSPFMQYIILYNKPWTSHFTSTNKLVITRGIFVLELLSGTVACSLFLSFELIHPINRNLELGSTAATAFDYVVAHLRYFELEHRRTGGGGYDAKCLCYPDQTASVSP